MNGLNEQRADYARYAVDRFQDKTGADECDVLTDLLCNLMHYADMMGEDFQNELNRATNNYQAEVECEEVEQGIISHEQYQLDQA